MAILWNTRTSVVAGRPPDCVAETMKYSLEVTEGYYTEGH